MASDSKIAIRKPDYGPAKVCSSCGESLPPSAFHVKRQARSGLSGRCRRCTSSYRKTPAMRQQENTRKRTRWATDEAWRAASNERLRARNALNRAEVNERQRARYLARSFGISVATYDAMWAHQAGLCAVCHRPERDAVNGVARRLAVDHDHRTGEVRGLLCRSCNTALGLALESPLMLRQLAAYIDRRR